MTTLRQIITDAFREGGIIAVGDVPEADSHVEALRRLENLISSIIGSELGEDLTDVTFGQHNVENVYGKGQDSSVEINQTYVPSNVRLIFNTNTANTVYLAPKPRDGARLAVVDNADNFATYNTIIDANSRSIEDAASVTLNTNGLVREWFYRADLSNWVRVTDLTAESESPFPSKYDDLLVTMLAVRLNPRYGAETSPEMMDTLTRLRRQFRAQYRQTRQVGVEEGLLRLGGRYGFYSSRDGAFDIGIG